jgi:prepilin-type N-terminal cleavage/methylation domain-containing protein
MRPCSKRGFTLVELLMAVNIMAVLVGTAVVASSEYSDEARCLETYTVLAQIIRSQKFHYMKHDQYYTANHEELRGHGVDLTEVEHFTYSTLTNEPGAFSVRADARAWAAGGWVLYNHMADPRWDCDGISIKRAWLPD